MLKSIEKILDKEFMIPAYQRGYRWTDQQVIDLLDDILEFEKKFEKNGTDDFYCLQPLVVKKNENGKYTVIDGQQRLTTICIIFRYLDDLLKKKYGLSKIYTIEYETRKDSKSFLENIKNINDTKNVEDIKNIDYLCMSNAFNKIKEWITKKIEDSKTTKFLETLLKRVSFIWYEVDSNTIEVDIFIRLNIWKIPLTNAELIKALFLIQIPENSTQILLSSQWDNFECRLQEEKFFSFINKESFSKLNRIEYIFDIISSKKEKEIEISNLRTDDDKKSYYIFNELIKDENSAKKLWDEVKKYFRIFQELYDDNEYYHFVGYLVHNGIKIKDIIENFNKESKDTFKEKYLKEEIRKLNEIETQIENLYYGDNDKKINKLLFLFNVISTMNSKLLKYPFNLHKSYKWSLEHIHAQNSMDIEPNEQKKLLNEQKSYVQDEKLKEDIENFLKKDETEEINKEFTKLQKNIFQEYTDDEDSIHDISNLALLSKKMNSSLKNYPFPIKKRKIIDFDIDSDKEGFIPLTTKNVFLKYYSKDTKESLTWNKKDREDYLEIIKETLKDYIGEK